VGESVAEKLIESNEHEREFEHGRIGK